MKKYIAITGLMACSAAVQAQKTNAYSHLIKAEAERMGKCMVARDYERFTTYLYKGVFKLMPKAELIKRMKEGVETMKQQGASFTKVVIGQPGAIIDTAGTLQCVVPEDVYVDAQRGNVISSSSVVAVSTDKGKTWKFLEVAGPDMLMQVRAQLPELSSKLKVVQQTQKRR